jgi:tetratricopeptide (TPR) repeat protein
VRGHVTVTCLGALALMGTACAGPPWFMGSPLNGRPSIPPASARRSVAEQQAAAARAHDAGHTVLELGALLALDDVERLTPEQGTWLVSLLERRAAEFHALGRSIPESRDLARVARVAPPRGAGLLGERAAAERAAGDTWLALGATEEARAAYGRATDLRATDMDFRIRALWGHPPSPATPLSELRAAVSALPLRAVPPFAAAYVTRGGSDRATLERALAAARQERKDALAVRIGEALLRVSRGAATPDAGAGLDGGAADLTPSDAGAGAPDASASDSGGGARDPLVPPPRQVPSDLDGWMVSGATVSARLLPLARSHPELLDGGARARRWIDLLLAEDPTAPDAVELAAIVFGRAGRFGGTERMLMELAYYTPDRADGLARGAAVWDHLGRTREACAQWIRAARWRDDPEDALWRRAISCSRKDPGAGDWRAIRSYVLGRARPDRRAAVAASLDASAGVPAPAQTNPDAGSPTPRCANDVTNVVRGHAFVDSLLCADGNELLKNVQGANPLPDGCFADSYGVSCGEHAFSLAVIPGKPLPAVPPGLLLLNEEALKQFRFASSKLESAPEEARKALDQALEKEQRAPQLWRLRGLTQIMGGHFDLALRDLDRALQLAPRQPLYRLEHGEVRARAGDRPGAIAELRALEKDVAASWSRWRELLSVLATLLDEQKDAAAPAYRKRACATGSKSFCGPRDRTRKQGN